jgi:ParB-like nuclease family protein
MPRKGPPYDPHEPMKVHPVAALFPMMTEDELNDLAADIKANGLVHPIVLDKDGQLIDGRNRLEACGRAVVEPTFTTLPEGQDPVAFILSCNVNRRHLNKGQQAMAVARACLFSKQTMRSLADAARLSAARIAQAKTVVEFAPDLADAVLAGVTPLNDAYAEARRRKEAAESEEAKFARLQSDAPDIAAMVQEERLTLTGALAELQERNRQEEQRLREEIENRRLLSRQLDTAIRMFEPRNMDPSAVALHFLEADGSLLDGTTEFTAERVRKAADVLQRYLTLLEKGAPNAS